MTKDFRKYYFERGLPHFHPENAVFFVTFRLLGSLPHEMIRRLQQERESRMAQMPNAPHEAAERLYNEQKRYFAKFDCELDNASCGKLHLKQPEIARRVAAKMHEYDSHLYNLIAYCIMPNHVHLVVDMTRKMEDGIDFPDGNPVSLSLVMRLIKGGSAYEINKYLNVSGAFWQQESYDHVVRNWKELRNIISYTLQNPVKAGLVDDWQHWDFSYVHENFA